MTDHVPFCQRPHHHLENWIAFHTPHPPQGTEKSKTTLIKPLEPTNHVLRKARRVLQQAKNYNTGRLLNNTQTLKTFNQTMWSTSIPCLCVYPCESICMYSNTHMLKNNLTVAYSHHHYLSPREIIRLGSKHFYQLNHLSLTNFLNKNYQEMKMVLATMWILIQRTPKKLSWKTKQYLIKSRN